MGNAFGITYLTPTVLDHGGPVMMNTDEARPAQSFDIEAYLATLKGARQRKLELARPMTLGEFMDAWLREARQRELENEEFRERLRAIRASQFTLKKPASLWLERERAERERDQAAAVDEAIQLHPQEARRAATDPIALSALMRHAMLRLRGMSNPRTVQQMIAERAAQGTEAAS